MRKIYLFCTLVVTMLCGSISYAQDFSNKGKDFWVGYGYHERMLQANGGSQDMVLYFATDQVTNISITIPGTGYSQTLTSLGGNNVLTSAIIPKTGAQDARLLTEGLSNKGIHITSDKAMVAYAHIYNASVSGATILFPSNTLGKEYYSVNYKNTSNQNNANCFFYVIAADPGTTTVEITPSGNTTGGWIAGTTYTVNLTQGQVYNVMGVLTSAANPWTGVDLTGSKIRSVSSASGGCKRIAVFSGSGRISITCNNNSSSSDNYMVQCFPRSAWGRKFLTVPAAGNQSFNLYRVCVLDPTTVVTINGVVTALPLQNNFYYELAQTNQPIKIEADKPITVAQYFSSQGSCGNGTTGDPEVIYLSPVEQNISKVLWNATPNFLITGHYFNVVIPNTGTAISSFRLDGAIPATGFTTHPQDPGYAYLRQSVIAGPHVIQSDSGFNAIAYGFGNAESYGYNAGTNVKDLYQQIGVTTDFGIEPTPTVCKGSPFRFKVSLPYCVNSMSWDLSNLPGPPAVPPVQNYSTCTPGVGGPDSTTVVNGKTLYWYSLPSSYSINVSGVYPVTITTTAPDLDGCGTIQEIEFDLSVFDPPSADFTITNSGCVAEAVQFFDNTTTPRPSYIWNWNFGDPASGPANTSGLKNPTHVFSTPGNYLVKFSTITTPGCISAEITKQVIVVPIPSASIAGTTTVCVGDPQPNITFTATDGTAPYTFSYHINTGPVIQLPSPTNTITIPVSTAVAGTFRYYLDAVKNTGSTLCSRTYSNTFVDVVVNANTGLALTSGSNSQSVCENIAIGNIDYTISGGGNNASVTGLPFGVTGVYNAGTFTISGTPTIPGTYPYTVTATGLCLPSSLNGVITVNPDAAISLTTGNNTQSLCINVPITDINYSISGGGTGGTVSGLPPGVSGSYSGGVFTIAGTPTATGIYNYTVNTTGTCVQRNATGTITVNPDATLSLSSGNNTQAVCENIFVSAIIYSIGGGGTGATVTGLPAGINGVYNAGVFTITGASTAVGTYPFTVTTTGTCVQKTLGGTITINPDAAISLTTGNNTQSLCINVPITDINYSISGGGTGGTVSGLPPGVSGSYSGGVFTIAGTPTVTGIYNYTVNTTGTCVQRNATGTITVNPDATLSLSSGNNTQAVCENIFVSAIIYSIGGGGTGATVTGLPAGINGVYNAGVFTITGASTAVGTYPFTVTTTGTCVQKTLGGTITINPDAVIVLTSAATTNNQELCLNSTITNILYTISGGGTGATISGLPAGVTGIYSAGVVTISGAPTVSGTFNYTVTTTGTCVQKIASGTILVNALPTPDFNITIPTCETKVLAFTDLSAPNSGVLNGWTWNFGDAATSTLQNPTHTYAAAGSYNVTLSVTNTKGCVSNPVLSRTITVNPQPATDFILPEVCLSDAFAQFLDATTITSGSVTWLWNFGDPGSGPLNTSTLQNPIHAYAAVGNYIVTLTTTSNNGCVTTLPKPFTVNGDIPISNFNALNPATMCANDLISIQDASTVNFGSVTKVEIYWDNVNFPGVFQTDDVPTPGEIYTHLYPNFQAPLTKTFQIRYRAYSGATCVNDRIKTITVNAAPKVQFLTMPDVCLDATPFQITQASEIGGVPGPPGVFTGTGVSATGIFNPALAGVGTHNITYTFTSTAGGCVDALTKPITVLDSASARFTYSALICESTAVDFNSTISTVPAASGSITGWTWDFGDPASGAANISTQQNPSHLFTGWGTYFVKLFVTTSKGCRSTVRTIPVFVNPIPRPNFSTPPSSCLPSANVTFNSSLSSIADGTQTSFTYLWNFGDPVSGILNSSTGSSPSHIYNTAGPFNVNLQITSGAGCVNNKIILLTTVHPQPTGSFTTDKNDVCVGQSIAFTDNSNPADGTAAQWNWTMGDATVRTSPSFNYTYGAAGPYVVSLFITNSYGCRSTTFTKPLTVNPYPVVNAGPDLFILQDGNDTIETIITAINPSYLWTPNLYFLSSNTIMNPIVKGVEDITYTLTVTGRGDCKSTDQVFIKVLKGPEIPNIFSPNGDGVHDKWEIKYLDTYPGGTVEVFNRYGQLIFRSVGYGVPWDGRVNGKEVPIGTYYYIVNPKNGRKVMSGYVDVIR